MINPLQQEIISYIIGNFVYLINEVHNNSYYWELHLCNLKLLIIIYYLFIIKIFNLFIFDKSTAVSIISYINSYYYWELRLCNLKLPIIIYYLFIIKISNLFIFDKSTAAGDN